jgi:adenylosuccinate synthase
MPANIIIGAQWGDEGKGRIADWLAADSDMVARYAGGDNAGHTVNVGGDTFKLHLVPSGILHEDVICLLGGGMVINPAKLVEELDGLAAREVDISPQRLLIADSAHIITPAHLALDGASEAHRADKALGTTKRGIGPAYTDKAARIGLRAGLMRSPDAFGEAVSESIKRGNRELETHYGQPTLDASEIVEAYQGYARRLAPHLVDGPQNVHAVLENSGARHAARHRSRQLSLRHEFVHCDGRRANRTGFRAELRGSGGWRRQGVQHARRRGTIPHRVT